MKDPREEGYLQDQAADKYEEGSAEFAHDTWINRAQVEQELAADCRQCYSVLDQMIGFTYAVHRLLITGFVEDVSPPESIGYVVSLLLARATSTAHEVCALLRAGFPIGAAARWRTLYEIKVVSRVLQIGHRGTAARYINHRWVQLQKHEALSWPLVDWSDYLTPSDVNRKVAQLVRRYGPEYKGSYGWAAEVTRRKLKVARPRFHDLERLAATCDRDNLVSVEKNRHQRANRSVHADSFGNLLMVDRNGLLNSGISIRGVKEAVMDTVLCLENIIDALLATWGRYPSSTTIDLMRSLNRGASATFLIDALGSRLPDLWPDDDSSSSQQ
jgi:Family of unknown function (DUF5677)